MTLLPVLHDAVCDPSRNLLPSPHHARFIDIVSLIKRIASAIADNFDDSKYRTLVLSKPRLATAFADTPMALECLTSIGFIRDGDIMRLPIITESTTPSTARTAQRDALIRLIADAERIITFSCEQIARGDDIEPADADVMDDTKTDGAGDESAESMRVDLSPEYDITAVRAALVALADEVAERRRHDEQTQTNDSLDVYVTTVNVLTALRELIERIIDGDENNKSAVDLSASPLREYASVGAFLGFCGIEYGDDGSIQRVDNEREQLRIKRALSILKRFSDERALSADQMELRTLGPIERKVRVFSYNPAFVNPKIGAANEEPNNDVVDMKLIIHAAADERRRNAAFERTDAFVTRNVQEKLKARTRRRYTATLIRILFHAENVLVVAFFRPAETLEALRRFVADCVTHPPPMFDLAVPPNGRIGLGDTTRTLRSLGFVPAATLHFITEMQSQSYLRPELLATMEPMSAVPIPVAENAVELAEMKSSQIDKLKAPVKPAGDDDDDLDAMAERLLRGGGSGTKAAKKKPKWLK